jgi:hypothetical protein
MERWVKCDGLSGLSIDKKRGQRDIIVKKWDALQDRFVFSIIPYVSVHQREAGGMARYIIAVYISGEMLTALLEGGRVVAWRHAQPYEISEADFNSWVAEPERLVDKPIDMTYGREV